ncbi:MAG: DUF362 domain-containing protein [Candidatus Sumerlaeota bacterium]|nr:DUF362 domain-containing protein [Candidatus Sumerlaeota bacterium]
MQHVPDYDYDLDRVHQAVRALLEPLGGMKAFVQPGARVLLKPNYVKSVHARTAVVTHPAVILAVAREVREAGGIPHVGDSPPLDSARTAIRRSGLWETEEGRRLPIVHFNRRVRIRAALPGPCEWFTFGCDPREFDLIINLPKMKTHCQVVISLALKNPFGFVKGRGKAWMHVARARTPEEFYRMLIQCHATVAPRLSILDGIVALSRYGPTSGDPLPMGLLMAATDATALDVVACEAVGADPKIVPLLAAAREMNFGQQDRSRIDVAGPDLKSLNIPRLELVHELVPIRFSPYHIIRGLWLYAKSWIGEYAKDIRNKRG